MPPIYYLNPPPNPFWDFVAGLEDHPFFAQRGQNVPPPARPQRPGGEQTRPPPDTASAAAAEASGNAKSKQADVNVEDPPEVDPSTVRSEQGMPFRGRGRFEKAFQAENSNETNDNNGCPGRAKNRHGRPHHHHHHHRRHGKGRRRSRSSSSSSSSCSSSSDTDRNKDNNPNTNTNWTPFGGRWWRNRGPPGGPWRNGPTFGPPPFMAAGSRGPIPGYPGGPGGFMGMGMGMGRGMGGGPRGGRGGHHHHPHGPHPHGPHSRGDPPFDPHHGRTGGFDLNAFLNNLGERIGVDLSTAAEGLGLKSPQSGDTDFEPRTDIFETENEYVMHLSLPGAKKTDLGVEYDGEHSALRITGVVHRPGVDEEMMTKLVVDGRKRETGVFEKNIRLGTPRDPAKVDVQGITAKMVDGVLVVRVPKVDKAFERKSVNVASSSPEIPVENPEDIYNNDNERDLLFDAEEQQGEDDQMMQDAYTDLPNSPPVQPYPAKASMSSSNDANGKRKEAEAERERSTTLDFEHPNETVETLPRYEAEATTTDAHEGKEEHMSDWEKEGSDDEGEYVKINVD
ncbi:uncharacterized protein PV06_07905 [Exophiala oligosperma]|uniref:SHSP domain-containing protein n=1 Tax=Exophiala oligosperma TaxID=215243 RepID=A0A0D2DC95_9EURO|nr:uncharacterized protein PV06_07905 [Exophiala oligosperma]KIW40728.1 hypothetical protein PV06_07905 [Exophiala oligosperma]